MLTRFLSPPEFGQLALLVAFAGLLTLAYNLGSLRGAMRTVFGGGGGDDDDDDDDDEDAPREGQTRRALGTALLLTAFVGGLGTLLLWALAPSVASLLIGQDEARQSVLWAAFAAGFAAVWRVASTVTRRERRPKTYVFLHLSRPALILAATVPLVAAGGGVEGAVLGLALGTGAAAAIALAATHSSYRVAFSLEDATTIARKGAPYIPIVLSFWTIQNAGIFLLSRYASFSEVGFYRVAAGVAMVASLAVVAFMRASGPLRREPIHAAVEEERGRQAAW